MYKSKLKQDSNRGSGIGPFGENSKLKSVSVNSSEKNIVPLRPVMSGSAIKLKVASEPAKPRLSVFGLGYVGAVSVACFSELGHTVIGVDPDKKKVRRINLGKSPIVEEHLEPMLKSGKEHNTIVATVDQKSAVLNSDITLVSVGTPSHADGSCDLKHLCLAVKNIGKALLEKIDYHLVIIRSTIPPNTTRDILIPILEKYSGKACGADFGVCFNPEFLRESSAIRDFYTPAKTVIGCFDKRSGDYAKTLYRDLPGKIFITRLEIAELVKYIDNTWHALKVSFGNEIGRIGKALEIDSHEVFDIFFEDKKLNISTHYLRPGFAFGGSCLPKDTRGISNLAQKHGVDIPLIDHVLQSNECHITHAVNLIQKQSVKTIGIVGLSFKSGTNDLRECPAINLIKRLINLGYKVRFFDPNIQPSDLILLGDDLFEKLLELQCSSVDELYETSRCIVLAHDQVYDIDKLFCEKDKKIFLSLVPQKKKLEIESSEGLCW